MITQEEYIAQNALGYEGDTFIHEELRKLCNKFKVGFIFETGSYRGATSKKLSELANVVNTVEIKQENYDIAVQELKDFHNVGIDLGNSVDVLKKNLPSIIDILSIPPVGNILFFLDAHWESYNPLLDELKIIAEHKLKPVIFIHDFKVPDRPDLGFDSYMGQDYDFEWIKPSLDEIYGKNGYEYHYNSEASGAKRGVIYIYPAEIKA
jgi:hypothetical protein